jgi:Fe-S cluster assembly iron-binding protein IscA
MLGLALDEPEADEKTIDIDGFNFLIDKEIGGFIEGAIVDFISSPHGEMFTVDNGVTGC